MGTVEYMAPEQVLGEPLDGRADQFALAVVAYQMMTGSTPFGPNTVATSDSKIVIMALLLPSTRNGHLPRGVDVVLAKGLSKKPTDRFATCRDFAMALGTAFSDAPTARCRLPRRRLCHCEPRPRSPCSHLAPRFKAVRRFAGAGNCGCARRGAVGRRSSGGHLEAVESQGRASRGDHDSGDTSHNRAGRHR